jgi:NitT/TauT family transport system permease protein
MKGMKADRWRTFVIAVVPGSLDWVFSAMKLNAGLALLGAFIGEFISSNIGLGYLVLRASSLYNVPRAIAASLFIAALALLFDWVSSTSWEEIGGIRRTLEASDIVDNSRSWNEL